VHGAGSRDDSRVVVELAVRNRGSLAIRSVEHLCHIGATCHRSHNSAGRGQFEHRCQVKQLQTQGTVFFWCLIVALASGLRRTARLRDGGRPAGRMPTALEGAAFEMENLAIY
jgi:hypothetical protein